jgi:hypothetical protein
LSKSEDSTNASTEHSDKEKVSRREFFTKGAAAGVTAAAFGAATVATAAESTEDISWDYVADVVVLGGGATGLAAAVRARDLGASVILLEQNYDLGGKMAHSSGWITLGGGDAIQERDRLGLDPDNLGLTASIVPPEALEDSADLLFEDTTDWSVVNAGAVPEYRFNDPEVQRAWAENAAAVRQFFMDNYVRFSRITGNNYGGGVSRARGPWAIMKLADTTDIEAGTLSLQDAGSVAEERSSPFNPQSLGPAPSAAGFGAPGWVWGGFVAARSLEYSGRKKGVQFMVNRHLDELIRDGNGNGRVIGVRASYTPRFDPETGERLEAFWSNGSVDDKKDSITVRARKGVIIGTGGWWGNPNFRTMFNPRYSEPSIQFGHSWLGPRHQDASGIIAGMKVGANLAGMLQSYGHGLATPQVFGNIGTGDVWDGVYPGHPTFPFVKAVGVSIGATGWDYVIAVNQVGKRIYNEASIAKEGATFAVWPPGQSGTNVPFKPGDWRNSSVEHVRGAYNEGSFAAAALAMNEGSVAPHYNPGPIWAIFDQTAVDDNGWEFRFPFIADPPDGNFFKADTIAELAKLVAANEFQKGQPLKYLEETINRYNGFFDAGKDDDFEKGTMYKIAKGPFYAARIPLAIIDSYGGLRINGKAQVLDMNGNVIPGLYAGGESSGAGRQHGIGRASVQGYIAATSAATEVVS